MLGWKIDFGKVDFSAPTWPRTMVTNATWHVAERGAELRTENGVLVGYALHDGTYKAWSLYGSLFVQGQASFVQSLAAGGRLEAAKRLVEDVIERPVVFP